MTSISLNASSVAAPTMTGTAFQMCKNLLQNCNPVDEAAELALRLTRLEARGPGDLENSWTRLETRYGVPARAFWSLRYRRPKEIAASIYLRLQAAYAAECERQARLLAHEAKITERIAGADHPAVAAAAAVVGAHSGEPTP
jgi:hypothetical protein